MRHTDNVFFVLHCLILRAAAASFSNKLSLGKRSAAFFCPLNRKIRVSDLKNFFSALYFSSGNFNRKGECLMKLQKVLSEKKETQRLYTIESGATLRTAAKKMISLKTDYLMVKAKDRTPAEFIGILTKVDIIRSLCMEKSNPDTDTVDDFMTRRMIVANVNDDVEYLMNVMVRHNISHLPVIDGKNIAGVISRNDILAQLNVERDIELQWLADCSGASPKLTVY